MSTSVVLDSTAIAALFFRDPYSERVEEALRDYDSLYTVDLAFAEVGNVAWKRVHLFKESYQPTARALESAVDFIERVCHLVRSRDLLAQALGLAVQQHTTIYDGLFLSLAKKMKARLLTTDEELHGRVESAPELKGLTRVP